MSKELGRQVHEHLVSLGIESPIKDPFKDNSTRLQEIAENHRKIMTSMGLDLTDDSLAETPMRVAKMYCQEVFSGLDYTHFPKCTTVENKFKYDEIVLVRNNIVRSTCEHHFQPIYGRASIAYIPGDKVLGLSKFSRIVDFFASRPQVQERLTEQVFAALAFILNTQDIAVVIEADHFCMKMRGVEEYCADTVTSKMGGRFRTQEAARQEVIQLLKK